MTRIGINKKVYPRPKFDRIVRQKMTHKERQKVMLAYRLSKYGHRTEQRKDLSRYFDHCKGVALIILLELKIFLHYITIASLLHDIEENTFMLKWHDIENIFKKKIYLAIRDLTIEEGKNYYKNLKYSEWWVILIKLCDRLHNLRTMVTLENEFKRRKLKETYDKVIPLIDVLRKKIPRKYKYAIEYLEKEIDYACKRVEKTLK